MVAGSAALVIGLSLGLIGAGGSILTIPVFVYLLKVDPILSGVYSMFVVGVSALTGCLRSIKQRQVDLKSVLAFGAPSVFGVFAARHFIDPYVPLQLCLGNGLIVAKANLFMLSQAVLMFYAAVKMLKPGNNEPMVSVRSNTPGKLVAVRGLLVGVVTGLFGIGGGFLIVPALHFWGGLPLRTAIGTALAIIFLNCFVGFANCIGSVEMDWGLLGRFSVVAVAGILAGTALAKQMPVVYLKRIFGILVLLVSLYSVYKTLVSFTGMPASL